MPVIKAKALALCVCPVVATPPTVLAVHPPARHAVARILHHAADRLDHKPDAAPKVIATALACTAPAGGGDGDPMVAASGGEAGAGAAGDTGKMVTVAVSTQNGGAGAATIGDGGDPATGHGGGFGGVGDEAFGGQGGLAATGGSPPAGARAAGGAATPRDANKAPATTTSHLAGGTVAAGAGGGQGGGTPVPLPPAAPLSAPSTVLQSRPPAASGAPEPTVWLLLITGFGLVGTIARTGRAARPGEDHPFRRH